MNKLKAWVVAGRFFVVPWVLGSTLLGVKLAGFNLMAWLLSFAVVFSAFLGCHYMNAWRDYIRGFDRLENGSKAKPYTMASQVLPRGWLSLREVKISSFAFFSLAIILFMLYAPKRVDTVVIFLLGIFFATTYTDWFKPKGFGEVAFFLGAGFAPCVFAYSMVKPVDFTALAGGVLLGLWTAMFCPLDQLPDIKSDLSNRVKNLAYMMFKAQIKPSAYVWFAGSAVATLTASFVVAGLLPIKFLSALGVLPLVHITGIIIDYDFDKGTLLFVVAACLYTLIPAAVL